MPIQSLEASFVQGMTYTPWAIQEKLRRALEGQSTQMGERNKRLAVLLHLNAALSTRYPKYRCDELRHQVTEWLIGEPSTTRLSEAQAVALLNWMTFKCPQTGDFVQRSTVPDEIEAILEQTGATAVDKRQLQLL